MNTTLTLVPDDESGERNTDARPRPQGDGPGDLEFVVHPRPRPEGAWRTVLLVGARGAASLLGLGANGASPAGRFSAPEVEAEAASAASTVEPDREFDAEASGVANAKANGVVDPADEHRLLLGNERGAVTAEYAIVIMAAVNSRKRT
ncbi:MAG: DUF4244 domain-containing protein [Leucobacter sp.]